VKTRAGVGDEITIPRGINDVKIMTVPLAMIERGRNRYFTLHLFRLEIHGRAAVINAAKTVVRAGCEENGLGEGSLSRTSMGDNSNVSHFRGVVLCHKAPLLM